MIGLRDFLAMLALGISLAGIAGIVAFVIDVLWLTVAFLVRAWESWYARRVTRAGYWPKAPRAGWAARRRLMTFDLGRSRG